MSPFTSHFEREIGFIVFGLWWERFAYVNFLFLPITPSVMSSVFPLYTWGNICMVLHKITASKTVLYVSITWGALKSTDVQDLFQSIKSERGVRGRHQPQESCNLPGRSQYASKTRNWSWRQQCFPNSLDCKNYPWSFFTTFISWPLHRNLDSASLALGL